MYCILIAGMPASGKTRFAGWLGRARGIAHLSKDAVKEILFDRVGFRSRAEKVALGEAAADILYLFAENQMRANRPFILENNFEDSSRAPVAALLARYGCAPVTVLFDGDIAAIYERYAQRERSPDRHTGHKVNDGYPERAAGAPRRIASLAEFRAGVEGRGYRRFDVGGRRIVVDCADFSSVDYEAINARIEACVREIEGGR